MRSKKMLLNITTSLLLQIITIVCGFIVPKLIISNFGSSINGLIISITQFLAYITLLESGFGPVVKSLLYKPIANKNKNEIEKILKSSEKFFRIISYIFIIYIIILCFIYPQIVSNEFDYLFTLSLIIIISISTFAEYYFGMTYRLYLQAEQKTYITSILQVLITILNTLCVVLLIYFKFSIQIVKLASTMIFVLRPIIQNIYIKKKYNLSLKNVESNYKIKEKWDGLAQHIAYVIHRNTDITILTLFTNTIEVSVYSVYLLIINGIKSLMQSFTNGLDATFGDMIAKNETKNLDKNFNLYEIVYFSISTVVFGVAFLMLLPFVNLYTSGISDANYYRPIFGSIFVLAEFIYIIRMPYSTIIFSAGHFKKTRKGSWVECIVNIIISILLVKRLGIIGVAIGTLIAMIIRTIELMYHASKNILKRKVINTCVKVFVVICEFTLIIIFGNLFSFITMNNYVTWIIQAVINTLIAIIIVIIFNLIFYKKELVLIKEILIRNIKKEK